MIIEFSVLNYFVSYVYICELDGPRDYLYFIICESNELRKRKSE